MDAETQRLLITALISASSAIIGGLGGAVFTARTNRANTKDTLDQTALLNEKTHLSALESEHEVWLRNKKQETYADFLSTAERRSGQLIATKFDTLPEADHTVAAARSKLKLVGSSAVRSAALAIEQALDEVEMNHKVVHRLYLEVHNDDDKNESAQTKLTAALDVSEAAFARASDEMVVFVEAARVDIGSYSDDDEIVDKENRASIDSIADAEPSVESLLPDIQKELA